MPGEMELFVAVNPTFNNAAIQSAGSRAGAEYANAFNSSFSKTRPLGNITGSVSEFEKSMEAANARVLAFGTSAGAIYLVKVAVDKLIASTVQVEKSLTDINVILGLGQTALRAFGNDMFKAAALTGQTFETASKVALEFARHGVSATETTKRMTSALELMRISGLSAQDSVNALTASINAFSKEGLTSEQIVNRLTAVDTKFAISAQDLAKAIQRVGSTAEDAGVQFNQLLGLVTAAQTATARGGAVIGNAFKSIFTRLGRPKVLEDLEAIGVRTKDASGQVLPMISILKNLASQYNHLGSAQRSFITEAVGGVYQVNILKAALADLGGGISIFDKASIAASQSTGLIEQRMAQLNETLSSKVNASMVSFTRLLSNMGQVGFSDSMKGGLALLHDNLEHLGNALEDFKPNDAGLQTAGKVVAQGLVKGFGSIISGPGVQIATVLFIKAFGMLGKFAIQAGEGLLGVNNALKAQEAIQASVGNYLSQHSAIMDKLIAKEISLKEVAILYTQELQKQAMYRNTVGTMARTIAPIMGVKQSSLSSGFIPSFSADDERMGALQHGYYPGAPYQKMIYDGRGGSSMGMVNQAESVQDFTNSRGNRATLVVPPNGFSSGFVPNFSVINDYGKKLSKQFNLVPIGEGESMHIQTEPNCLGIACELAKQFGFIPPKDKYAVFSLIHYQKLNKLYGGDLGRSMASIVIREKDIYGKDVHASFEYKNKEFNFGPHNTQGWKISTRIPLSRAAEGYIPNFAQDYAFSLLPRSRMSTLAKLKNPQAQYEKEVVQQVLNHPELGFENFTHLQALNGPQHLTGNNARADFFARYMGRPTFLDAKYSLGNEMKLSSMGEKEQSIRALFEMFHSNPALVAYLAQIDPTVANRGYSDFGIGTIFSHPPRSTTLKNYAKVGIPFTNLNKMMIGAAGGFVPNLNDIGFSNYSLDYGTKGIAALLGNKQIGEIEWSKELNQSDSAHELEHIGVNQGFRHQGISRLLYDQMFAQNRGARFSGALIPQGLRAWQKMMKGMPVTATTVFPQMYRADVAKSAEFSQWGKFSDDVQTLNAAQFKEMINAKLASITNQEEFRRYFNDNNFGLLTQHAGGFIPNFAPVTLWRGVGGRRIKQLQDSNYLDKESAHNIIWQTFGQYPKSRFSSAFGPEMSINDIKELIYSHQADSTKGLISSSKSQKIAQGFSGLGLKSLGSMEIPSSRIFDEEKMQKLLTRFGPKRLSQAISNRKKFIGLDINGFLKDNNAYPGEEEVALYSHGFIPNFSPLSDAAQREMGAGYSASQIRVGQSPTLSTASNPSGLGIYNSTEGSLDTGIALARMAGVDPKTKGMASGFVPNFGIEESLMMGVMMASMGGLKDKMDKLSFGYDKQIASMRKMDEAYSQAISGFRATLPGETYKLKDKIFSRADRKKEYTDENTLKQDILAAFGKKFPGSDKLSFEDQAIQGRVEGYRSYEKGLEQQSSRLSRYSLGGMLGAPIVGGFISSSLTAGGKDDAAKAVTTLGEGAMEAGQALFALGNKGGVVLGAFLMAGKAQEVVSQWSSGLGVAQKGLDVAKTKLENLSSAITTVSQGYETLNSLYASGTTSLSQFFALTKNLSVSLSQLSSIKGGADIARAMQSAGTLEKRQEAGARAIDLANEEMQEKQLGVEEGKFNESHLYARHFSGMFEAVGKEDETRAKSVREMAAGLVEGQIFRGMGKDARGITARFAEGTGTYSDVNKVMSNLGKSSYFTGQSAGDQKIIQEQLAYMLKSITVPDEYAKENEENISKLKLSHVQELAARNRYNAELQNLLNKGIIISSFENLRTNQGFTQQGRENQTLGIFEESQNKLASLYTAEGTMLGIRGNTKIGQIARKADLETQQKYALGAQSVGTELAKSAQQHFANIQEAGKKFTVEGQPVSMTDFDKYLANFLSERIAATSGANAGSLLEAQKTGGAAGLAKAFLGSDAQERLGQQQYEALLLNLETAASSQKILEEIGKTVAEANDIAKNGQSEIKDTILETQLAIVASNLKDVGGLFGGKAALGKNASRMLHREIMRDESRMEHGGNERIRGEAAGKLMDIIPPNFRNAQDPYIQALQQNIFRGFQFQNQKIGGNSQLWRYIQKNLGPGIAAAQTTTNFPLAGQVTPGTQTGSMKDILGSIANPLDESVGHAADDMDNFGDKLWELGGKADDLFKSWEAAQKATEDLVGKINANRPNGPLTPNINNHPTAEAFENTFKVGGGVVAGGITASILARKYFGNKIAPIIPTGKDIPNLPTGTSGIRIIPQQPELGEGGMPNLSKQARESIERLAKEGKGPEAYAAQKVVERINAEEQLGKTARTISTDELPKFSPNMEGEGKYGLGKGLNFEPRGKGNLAEAFAPLQAGRLKFLTPFLQSPIVKFAGKLAGPLSAGFSAINAYQDYQQGNKLGAGEDIGLGALAFAGPIGIAASMGGGYVKSGTERALSEGNAAQQKVANQYYINSLHQIENRVKAQGFTNFPKLDYDMGAFNQNWQKITEWRNQNTNPSSTPTTNPTSQNNVQSFKIEDGKLIIQLDLSKASQQINEKISIAVADAIAGQRRPSKVVSNA